MRNLGIPLLGLAALSATAWAETPILPFDEVAQGMRGIGRTVFAGTRIEEFDVEILGKLPNIGPSRNLILARCSGGPLAETGVLSGMSGSPVTIDGKLIGAVAYSWGFSKAPIAGITPIEEMLAIAHLGSDAPGPRAGGLGPGGGWLTPLVQPARRTAFLADRLRALTPPTASAVRVGVPLAVSGVGASGLARILPDLALAGFDPVQLGGAGGSTLPSPALEPGSAAALKLVSGDFEMSASGTVTWVEGDQVLIFGHPLFGLGGIDLPLTGADVQVLLPSLEQSSRMAVPLGEVGALRQDRASGMLGRIGATPRMIPVRLQLERSAGAGRTFSFDIADDPLLSPLLLYVSLNGVLASTERVFGDATVRLAEGSVIKMASGTDVAVDNIFAGPTAFDYGTGLAAYILYVLLNNVWAPPQITGINLILEYDEAPRIARIRRAAVDRYRVLPGDTVRVDVRLSPYRGPERRLETRVEIPGETPPGRLTLHVRGAVAVARAEAQDESALPRDLDHLIRLINQLRRNDRIYITADHTDSGIRLNGARLPNLPPSVASVLAQPGSRTDASPLMRRRLIEESIPTDDAVEGSTSIEIEVAER